MEQFNRALLDMLSKTVKSGGQDWNIRLPMFYLHIRLPCNSRLVNLCSFYYMVGIPTKATLYPPVVQGMIVLMIIRVRCYRPCHADAWELAWQSVKKAQQKQKMQHDKKARDFTFSPGDRIFVYMPAIRSGPAYKLKRPYKGQYHVITTHPNGVELCSVKHPKAKTICVALNRVRYCPTAITNKEVVMVRPVTNEDLEEDVENSESKEEKGGEVEATNIPQMCNGLDAEETRDIQNAWESRLRPSSPC